MVNTRPEIPVLRWSLPLALLALLLSAPATYAQVGAVADTIPADTALHRPGPDSTVAVSHSLFWHLGDDFIRQAGTPFRADGRDWLNIGEGMVGIGMQVMSDGAADEFMRGLREASGAVDAASPYVTEFGGTYGYVGSALFIGYSFLFDDRKGKETSLLLTEALVTSGVWAQVFKYAAGRERPGSSHDYRLRYGGRWHGPLERFTNKDHLPSSAFSSFPSGHTTTAFAIATVFAEQYDETPVVSIIAYSAATLVGISRMTEHAHWASDVLAGGLLGYLCAHDVVANHRRNEGRISDASAAPGIDYHFTLGMAEDGPRLGIVLTR